MEPVQFNCPLCAGLFQIDPSMAGGQVLCPSCQGTVTIPALSASPPAEAPAGVQELSCPLCTGVFQVTADMAGQQVSCPHCTGLVMIPAGSGAPSANEPPTGEIVAPAPYAPPPGPATGTPGYAAPQPIEPPSESPSPQSYAASAPKPNPAVDSSPNRNFYPPGFEPKPSAPEQGAKAAPTPATPQTDHRYPPGFDPKPTPQPPTGPAAPTSQPAKVRDQSSSKAPATAPASQPRTDINSLRPPGAAGPTVPPQETSSPVDAKVDELLPPGASAPTSSTTKKRSKADDLLPPGAEAKPEESAHKQKALPEDEKNRPIKKSKDIVIPTDDGGVVTLHEPAKTVIGQGGSQVRLRTLSAEEKTRKRSLKSLVMWVICVLVLVGVLIVLVNK